MVCISHQLTFRLQLVFHEINTINTVLKCYSGCSWDQDKDSASLEHDRRRVLERTSSVLPLITSLGNDIEFLREHILPQIIYEHTAKVWIQRSTATSVHTKQPLEAKRSSVLQSRKSSISGSTDSTKSWKSLDRIRRLNQSVWVERVHKSPDWYGREIHTQSSNVEPLCKLSCTTLRNEVWWLILTPKFWRAFSYSWATFWSAMTTSSPSTAYRSKYRSG